MTEETERCIPTVQRTRDVLVWALRHHAASTGRPRKVVHGISNERAIAIIRSVLKGRGRDEPVSELTWQTARSLANATSCVTDKAWYNAPRWRGEAST